MNLSAESVYNVGFDVWNTIIGIAMTMFTTSPTAASGTVYNTVYTIYCALRSIGVPLTMCFFLMALIRDNVDKDSGIIPRQLIKDMAKYTLIIGVLNNLWEIMGYIISITDGITSAIAASSTITMTASSDLTQLISDVTGLTNSVNPHFSMFELAQFFSDLKAWMVEQVSIWAIHVMFFISALAFLVAVVACSLSILSASFQRILKPLMIMPFAAILVAFAAGSQDQERTALQYIKTFIGFCLSGAFMVVCINIGTALCNGGLIVFDTTGMDITSRILYIGIQMIVSPIVIAGLVKTVDSVIGRFL